MRSEKEALELLSPHNYSAFLKERNRVNTWSCGSHLAFTLNAFGLVNIRPGYHPNLVMHLSDVDSVLASLDDGKIIDCGHEYLRDNYADLPKDNRYPGHVFAIFKAGARYFVSQGYMHRYRSSVLAYSRREVRAMLTRIITDLCDYQGVKTWKDIRFDTYKKYFRTKLTAYPDIPLKRGNRVNNLVLFYKTWTAMRLNRL